MLPYRDRAIVLRQYSINEADKIINLLTCRHGLIRAIVKGVRRTYSKFGARLEPLNSIDVQLYPGKNLDTITQVNIIDSFAALIVKNYRSYIIACAILETAEKSTDKYRIPVPKLYELTNNALHALAFGNLANDLILNSYMLLVIKIAGWQLQLNECTICSKPGPHKVFNIPSGGTICLKCAPRNSVITPWAVIKFVIALQDRNLDYAKNFAYIYRKQASKLITAYLEWHLECQLKTLPLVQKEYSE